jgi:hypothetical protein
MGSNSMAVALESVPLHPTVKAEGVVVISRKVVALETGDIEVLTMSDGTVLVDGARVDPIAVTKSIPMKERNFGT